MTGLPSASTTPSPAATALADDPTPTTRDSSQLPTQTARPRATRPQPTSTADSNDPAETSEPTSGIDNNDGTRDAGDDPVVIAVERDTAALRGLQPKDDVPEIFITEEQLRVNLTEDMKTDYPREEARMDAVALWLLRLSDERSFDLYQFYIDMLSEGVAGYYDPDENELFVLSDQEELGPQARETLSHEYIHSLQDQHYDLRRLLPDDSKDDDRNLAARATAEGDASLAGLMYAYQHMSQEDFQELIAASENASTEMLDRAPTYIRRGFIFPYDEGVTFVSKLIEAGGFDKVNAALADPPRSTEQIIHPEKYMELPRDEPVAMLMPPLTSTLGAGWSLSDYATFGEFDLQIVLSDNNAADPEGAAAGWGGGQYDFYQRGDDALLIMATRWDTTRDANEFEAALNETFEDTTKVGELWQDGGRFFGLKRTDDQIVLVAATKAEFVQSALDDVK
jgi:hypothetical protein